MTSRQDFEKALRFTLRWEGGYSHHPNDPGGATNKGITQATYDSWRNQNGKPKRPVSEATTDEIEKIYYEWFWLPRCPDFKWPLCLALFDSGVNFGQRGLALLWQPIVGAEVDGVWGRQTQALSLEYVNQNGAVKAALELALARLNYRIRRVSWDWSQKVFLAGWIARDTDLIREVCNANC